MCQRQRSSVSGTQFTCFTGTKIQILTQRARCRLYCEAIYSADNSWYTARIDKVNSDGTCSVTYTDYGNSEVVSIKHMRLNSTLNALKKPTENPVELAAKQLEKELAAKAGGAGGAGKAGVDKNDKKRKDKEPSEIAGAKEVEEMGDFVVPEKLKILLTDSEDVKATKRKKVSLDRALIEPY